MEQIRQTCDNLETNLRTLVNQIAELVPEPTPAPELAPEQEVDDDTIIRATDVRTVPSMTTRNTTYRLRRFTNGLFDCTCLAFKFATGNHWCKHLTTWSDDMTPATTD